MFTAAFFGLQRFGLPGRCHRARPCGLEAVAGSENGKVIVRVIDDGPGIPDEIVNRIFDPFFTTKDVGQGTGLGLDIARRIVQRHRGAIDVHTGTGGTEFCVTLPASGAAHAFRRSRDPS